MPPTNTSGFQSAAARWTPKMCSAKERLKRFKQLKNVKLQMGRRFISESKNTIPTTGRRKKSKKGLGSCLLGNVSLQKGIKGPRWPR
jgi:hypothetical protein